MALAREKYTNQYPYYVGKAMNQGSAARVYTAAVPAEEWPFKEVPASKPSRKTREQIIEEQKVEYAAAIKSLVKISFVALAALWILFLGIVFTSAKCTEIKCSLNEINEQNAIIENENIILKTQIETAGTMGKIEKVAVDKLGMVYPSDKECTFLTPHVAGADGEQNLRTIIKSKAYKKAE